MNDSDDLEIEMPELASDDPLRGFLPTAFGKKSKDANIAAQIDRSKRAVEKDSVRPILSMKESNVISGLVLEYFFQMFCVTAFGVKNESWTGS